MADMMGDIFEKIGCALIMMVLGSIAFFVGIIYVFYRFVPSPWGFVSFIVLVVAYAIYAKVKK